MKESQMTSSFGPSYPTVNIVSELCSDGTLFDLLVRFGAKGLNELQTIHILKDVCRGLLHMHSQKPPIAHRDIKVENILLSNKVFKLCDFGSASTDTLTHPSGQK
jgi:AP2-associated kinase